ncbi:MAG TPA: glucose-1-phosphate thymidylyltransferase [Methylophilaceae bacterium]|jgi:glucose-1-phosphate thymidylyltransferase|nr:glucose-1-phosphate thymidylyltransferase [Methylophilaceae bacterium]
MSNRKGIILAGGTGSRLYPATIGISKQLLPIYDKPMIYYPLSTLMSAGINDIVVILRKEDFASFSLVLGDGSQWGISISYIFQPSPDGLAQAYILAENFLAGSASAMILGDNIFYGHRFGKDLTKISLKTDIKIFGYQVADPSSYGVACFDSLGRVSAIEEKPVNPQSSYAVTGLYFLDESASHRAKDVMPSARGELEITSLLEMYINDDLLTIKKLGKGFAWLDTGTHENLLDSANFIRSLQIRQGTQIGCIEEIALEQGWIDEEQVLKQAHKLSKTLYGEYLTSIIAPQS